MDTREKIIFTCEELALKRGMGFYNISMEELAEEAGISKRTIYRYFDSKEKLIEVTIDHIMNNIMLKNFELVNKEKDIDEIIVGILKNVSYLVNQQVILDLSKHYPLVWQKMDRIRQSKIELFITTILSNNQVKFRWRVDPKIFKASFLAAMIAVLTPSFLLENGLTFEEAGKSFINMFFFGAVERDPESGENIF